MINFKEYFQDVCPVMRYVIRPFVLIAFMVLVYNVMALLWNDGVHRYYRYKIQSGGMTNMTLEEMRAFKDREDELYLPNVLQN